MIIENRINVNDDKDGIHQTESAPHVGVHQTASDMMGDRIIDTTCRGAPNGIRHDGRSNK